MSVYHFPYHYGVEPLLITGGIKWFILVAENWFQTLTSYFESDIHVTWSTG
jgi:hypothetical protein